MLPAQCMVQEAPFREKKAPLSALGIAGSGVGTVGILLVLFCILQLSEQHYFIART